MKFKAAVWLLLGALVGGALGVGGLMLYQFWQSRGVAPTRDGPGDRLSRLPTFGRLRPSGPPTSVAALGRLTPRGEVIDVGGLMGDRLGKLTVEEDQWVEKDYVLGTLESYDERKAEREAIAAQLKEAAARRTAELAFADARIEEAEVGVEQAEKLAPKDVEAQKAKVSLLSSELKTAEKDLKRMRSLTSQDTIPQQKLDQQAQLVERFRQELNAASATLAKAETGLALNLQKAQAELVAAQAGRDRADAATQLEALRRSLKAAEARLKRTELRAPRSGRVLRILTRPSERTDARPILKLGDTSVMYVVAEVYETDVLWVRPGQSAKVRSPALPEELSGTVERVGNLIAKRDVLHIDPAAAADARVVEVWVRLGSSEAASRLTNLQVDVRIEMDATRR
jgi:HlyD family secretion protein